MKRSLLLTSTLVGFAAATMMFSGCNKPPERASVEDKSISGKAFAISDLAEITSEERSVYIKADSDAMLAAADKGVKQLNLEGKASELLSKIKNKATKAALDEQLKAGSIAIVVLDDQVKVLKVVEDVELSNKYDVLSRTYLGKLKALSKKPEAKFQADEKEKVLALKYTAPKDTPDKEKFGMVEITSLKVEKFGSLENDTDDYGQRKHFLVVKERPFEMATHIVIGGEVNAAGELLDPPTAEELAAQKAAEAKE